LHSADSGTSLYTSRVSTVTPDDAEPNFAKVATQPGLSTSENALFSELEKLMALNTPVDRATADLPILWGLVGRTGDSETLKDLINGAITDLPGPQREALVCLFPDDLGSGSGNLTGRKRRAARRLGKPYNTARARRDGQSNDFDLLLISLVRSISVAESEPGSGPDTGGGPHTQGVSASGPSAEQRWFRLSPLTVGVGVLVVALLASIVLFALNGDDGRGLASVLTVDVVDAAPATTLTDPAAPRSGVATPEVLGDAQVGRIPNCDRPIGGPLVPATDNVWISPLMINAYQEAGDGGFELACPSATAQQWGAVWFQPIDGADPSQGGTIVVSGTGAESDSAAVFLPKTIWLAYHNVGLDGGVSAQSLAGFPTEFRVDDEGHWIAGTTLGDLIIAEQPNASGRWIPHQAVPIWESYGGIHGQLGLPMTNVEYVDGFITQTYERGKAFVDLDGVVKAEIYDQAVVDADVAALPRRVDGILSTYDSTDWWIDSEGMRHWIPSGPDHDDGAMWECLGGLDSTIAEDLNGWVIAAFPLGDNATCPTT